MARQGLFSLFSGINPVPVKGYTASGNEHGVSVPSLQVTNGRIDLNPVNNVCLLRIPSDTGFGLYNRTGEYYLLSIQPNGESFWTNTMFCGGNIVAGTANPSNSRLYIDGNAHINGVQRFRPYTLETLPSAASNTGAIAYVTDGTYPLAVSDGVNWLFPGSGGGGGGNPTWASITGKPTTVSGYGITDAVLATDSRLTDARTPVEHTQSWNTITGIPSILTKRFDQVAPPSNPLNGDLWIERTGTGSIVESWEWDSTTSQWLGKVESATSSITNYATSGAFIVSSPVRYKNGVGVYFVRAEVVAITGANHTAGSYYNISIQTGTGANTTWTNTGVVLDTQALVANTQTVYAWGLNVNSVSPYLRVNYARVGTPSNTGFAFTVFYRRIR